jgi:hypothetical protein
MILLIFAYLKAEIIDMSHQAGLFLSFSVLFFLSSFLPSPLPSFPASFFSLALFSDSDLLYSPGWS